MAKAPDAFRTISEVSEWLDTPAHVLRFWESKFSQVKPVKRAGGRRYYRPDDMALLAGIKILLHEQGMTIKGAQKLLREKGVKHVAAMSPPFDGEAAEDEVIEATAVETKSAVTADENLPIPAPEVLPDIVEDGPAEVDASPDEDIEPELFELEPEPEPVAANTPTMPPPAARPDAPQAADPGDSVIALPQDPEPMAPRVSLLSLLRDAETEALRSRAARIAPYAVRLRDLRDRMRAR